MIIGIDIRVLAAARRSGVQEYTEQVISRMVKLAPEHQFKFFFSSFRGVLPRYDWLLAPNVKLYSYQKSNNILFASSRVLDRPHVDEMMGGADVFFSPHFLPVSLSKKCRRVTTFHDLSFVRFPEFFTARQMLWHRFAYPERTARFSDQIIAVSESTKADLVHYYNIDPAHISPIHLASSIERPSEEDLSYFKKSRRLPEQYIFCFATLEPRKNIVSAIKAFTILKENPVYQNLKLIIGGARGWYYEKTLKEIQSSPHRHDILYLGYIEREREYYYSLASLFLYPSFFEGFGLPVIEAMACGTPIITSHNSSMAEVAGDAALLVDPYNVSDIASATDTLLQNQGLRAQLVQKEIQRINQFSWDRCALETLKVITHS